MAPRLLVGRLVGYAAGNAHVADLLERAGHGVVAIDPDADPGAIQHVDLVLLGGDEGWVEGSVDKLAPYARPRQMFLHTALSAGVQLMDAVETRQAIVMCAHNLFGDVWVTSAADELGETVVGLLVAEMGGMNLPVADVDRPVLAAAAHLRALEATVRLDSFDLITSVLPDAEALRGAYLDAPAGAVAPADAEAEALEATAGAIADPAVRRVFVDLARRQAERAGDTDGQLWAYSKYEGKL